jgi:hypothetical protein
LVAGGLLVAHGTASAVARKTPAAGTPAQDTTLMIGTPCTVTARACVDLTTQKAWLFKDNAIERGPVDITSGGPGEETPTGNFSVAWKDRNHIASNAALTPMPYSVFFATGGVAFHGGSLQRQSAGCVHLDLDDAIIFYDSLAIGAPVQVRGVAPVKDTSSSGNNGRSGSRDDRRNGPDRPGNGPDRPGNGPDRPGNGPPIHDDSIPPSTNDGIPPSTDGSLPPSRDDAPPAGDFGSSSSSGRSQPVSRNRGRSDSNSSSPAGSDDPLGSAGG